MLNCVEKNESGKLTIELSGTLAREETQEQGKTLLSLIKKQRKIIFDLSKIERIDTFGASLLAALDQKAKAIGADLTFINVPPNAIQVLERFHILPPPSTKTRSISDSLEDLGARGFDSYERAKSLLYLVSDTFLLSIAGAKRTQKVRKGAVWLEANRIGIEALGIVCLIAFLVGTVVALQAASILRMFGADILVADMIGISMTREMAPLMTAIIMAGRSGASIAAQIATMTINEEIAGLRTMGLDPIKYVVVPKFRAITLTMPGLTIFANFCGIFGGFIVAILYMELGVTAFLHQLGQALYVKDVLTSLLKSIVFAWIIVCIAAHKGFQAYGGSDSVGKVTTSSVVSSIFWCIVADAIFSLIFYF